ncbi:hypothetical protein Pcinc_031515, partial [Petrolisthes cinctipes]
VSAYNQKKVEILKLEVPESPQVGQEVTLTCRFKLHGHSHHLYTVSWWRGKDQFYTYKGTTYDPKHAYSFRGIQVKTEDSTEESVVLSNVSEETSGVFKCEVMGEGPSFRTAVKTKTMTVIVPPRSVEISPSFPPVYHSGEKIQLNCTASGSKPGARINWNINGAPVRPTEVQRLPDYEDYRKRVTSTATLTWEAPIYFLNNQAKVSCHAVVAGHTTTVDKDIYLHPASSAAYNHQYASAGCQLSTTWTILSLASLLLARAIP